MKNLKKLIRLLLCLVMMIGTLTAVYGEEADEDARKGSGVMIEGPVYEKTDAVLPSGASYFPLDVSYRQSESRTMLDMINDFRTGSEAWAWDERNENKIYYTNLKTLTYDYELERVAMQRAAEIVLSFAHSRPDGSSCWTAYPDTFMYGYKGENIAAGYTSASSVFVGWREDNDPYSGQGHRRNMLNENFTSVGIGCAVYNGRKYWVQEFSSNIVDTNQPEYSESTVSVNVPIAQADGSLRISFTDSAYQNNPSVVMGAGESLDLPAVSAKFYYKNSQVKDLSNAVEITSSDSSVVKVENGKLTAVKSGSAIITYTAVFGTYTGGMQLNVTVSGHAHDYRLDSWDWAEDYSEAWANFVCASDASHTERVKAERIDKEETEPTCAKEGSTVYTAYVTFEGKEYSDTRTITVPVLACQYELTNWEWNNDYSGAWANFVDTSDSSRTERVQAHTITVEETEPDCENEGYTLYTAYVTFNDTEYTDEKSIAIPALGHQYELSYWDWASDYSSASAVFVCSRDSSHTQRVSASINTQETSDEKIYTAHVSFEEKTYTDTKTVPKSKMPQSVKMTYDAVYFVYGGAYEVEVEVLPADADQTLTWTSSDPGIATVDNNGVVRGVKPGTAYITATTVNGLSDTLEIRIMFEDVWDIDKFYFEPVYWALDNGITTGINLSHFKPNDKITRGQIVTFLYRAAGEPAVSGSMQFKDVKKSDYFYNAVLWASKNGITTGTSETEFSPKSPCTRAQIVTFLWRFKGEPTPSSSPGFRDVKDSAYYAKAVEWAFENNVTTGTSATTFSPNSTCTRGQAVTFLSRAAQ